LFAGENAWVMASMTRMEQTGQSGTSSGSASGVSEAPSEPGLLAIGLQPRDRIIERSAGSISGITLRSGITSIPASRVFRLPSIG
jgi:hypothetical protein